MERSLTSLLCAAASAGFSLPAFPSPGSHFRPPDHVATPRFLLQPQTEENWEAGRVQGLCGSPFILAGSAVMSGDKQ